MRVAFVSGHLDLTKEEFDLHYKGLIEEAHARGDSFVVGDARGGDVMAQALIARLGGKAAIYHMFTAPRNAVKGLELCGGFTRDKERDEAMTAASNYDIAWVRPGREDCGTWRNIERRKKK
jgi:hypothetical protein